MAFLEKFGFGRELNADATAMANGGEGVVDVESWLGCSVAMLGMKEWSRGIV